MLAMFSARKRFAPSDLEGLHVPCEWMEGLGRCELGRPLIVCAPCIGINNGGRFLQEVGVCYKLANSCDILSNLSDALMALEGSLEGIKLGESGDITQIKLEDLTVPVDVLMAGPPCPPWASNGKKCPGEDVRTRVFLAVLLWTIYLTRHGGLLWALLENVQGVLHKIAGCAEPFMAIAIRFLEEHAPEMAWRVDLLNAADYKLPQSRRRVFLQGVRSSVIIQPRVCLCCGRFHEVSMEVLLYVYCRVIDNLRKDFGHNPGKEILGTMEKPPQPMDPFGTVSLASFLKPNLPCTARESLTSIMRTNLGNYEKLIRDKIEAGDVTPGTLVVCELDRAFGKKYSPSMTVGMSPCLKTQLKYLFVISTDDLQLPDAERAYFRWILPQERCALQGVHPRLALHLCNSDLLHALGNAYPVPLIAACGMPVLQMIEKWGRLNSWPPPLSPGDLLELPDVAGHFLPLLTAKPKKERKPKSKSEPKPKLSPKKGKVRKKISKPSLRSVE